MITLCYALIQPHLLHGLTLWGSTFPCDAQKQRQIGEGRVSWVRG